MHLKQLFKKINFIQQLIFFKFLIKKINFGVNQCISGQVISQHMEFITFAISQPF